jgi:hypothetical protein
MAVESGFMRFAALDRGTLLRLEGHPVQAIRYLIGHPLIALRMTARDIGSALYAPLSVLVTQIEGERGLSTTGRRRSSASSRTTGSPRSRRSSMRS